MAVVLSMMFSITAISQDYKNWVQHAPRLSDSFFLTDSARVVASHVMSYQLSTGGWPKNINFFHDHCNRPLSVNEGTIDNGATQTEIRYLMRLYKATGDTLYLNASIRGIEYVLKMQYPNGGWPQYWPRKDHYHAHITYNDNAMINVMEMLRDIYQQKPPFDQGISAEIKGRAIEAFNLGVQCILATQIEQKGYPSVWCQQHDEVTLQPCGARAYELPGLVGSESAGIVMLLMSLPNPSDEVKRSIEGAVNWYRRSSIPGDSTMWARFYTIEENRPFFCGRDGIMRFDLNEVEEERRNGYQWYGRYGVKVLKRYEAWKRENP